MGVECESRRSVDFEKGIVVDSEKWLREFPLSSSILSDNLLLSRDPLSTISSSPPDSYTIPQSTLQFLGRLILSADGQLYGADAEQPPTEVELPPEPIPRQYPGAGIVRGGLQ